MTKDFWYIFSPIGEATAGAVRNAKLRFAFWESVYGALPHPPTKGSAFGFRKGQCPLTPCRGCVKFVVASKTRKARLFCRERTNAYVTKEKRKLDKVLRRKYRFYLKALFRSIDNIIL